MANRVSTVWPDEHYHDLAIDPEKVVDELAKKAAYELHTSTNLRLSAHGFPLCIPTIIA